MFYLRGFADDPFTIGAESLGPIAKPVQDGITQAGHPMEKLLEKNMEMIPVFWKLSLLCTGFKWEIDNIYIDLIFPNIWKIVLLNPTQNPNCYII